VRYLVFAPALEIEGINACVRYAIDRLRAYHINPGGAHCSLRPG